MAGERGIVAVRHEALKKEYGLDRPVLVQYGIYVGHGVMGVSLAGYIRNSSLDPSLETESPATGAAGLLLRSQRRRVPLASNGFSPRAQAERF